MTSKYDNTAAVIAYLGTSRTGLWRLRQLPDFPKPFAFPGQADKLVWDHDELAAWAHSNRRRVTSEEPTHLRRSRGSKQLDNHAK